MFIFFYVYRCFDEPHLRANFKISLFRDRFHIALSNSIVHATDEAGFFLGRALVSIGQLMYQEKHAHKYLMNFFFDIYS